MHKKMKVMSLAVVLVGGILIYATPYIKMEFVGSATYTEQDAREYHFYTPEILKNMPRISDHYQFDFANITGPAKHVHAVKFYGASDVSKIDSYLRSIGYKKQEECDIDASCWRGSDPQETIYVGMLNGEKMVLVQVVTDFSNTQ